MELLKLSFQQQQLQYSNHQISIGGRPCRYLQDGAGSPGAKLIGTQSTTLKTGWGAKSWNEDEWGELKDAVSQPSGLSITASVGSVDIPDVILHFSRTRIYSFSRRGF